MAARPPAKPATAPSAVQRAEALMAPRREATARIPTLTDLVSEPAAPATVAAPPAAAPAAPAASAADAARVALEEAVFQRLRARLEAEMREAIERRIVPEIAARLREAIPAAVEQALREGLPPPRRP